MEKQAKFKEYAPKRTTVQATKIEEPCSRLNMMSNVYTYRGLEFTCGVMPVVGDYLVLDRLGAIPKHMGQKAFDKMYNLTNA